MGMAGSCRPLPVPPGGIGFAEAQIVRHGAMGQVSVLHDHAMWRRSHFERQAANIMAAQQDAPC